MKKKLKPYYQRILELAYSAAELSRHGTKKLSGIISDMVAIATDYKDKKLPANELKRDRTYNQLAGKLTTWLYILQELKWPTNLTQKEVKVLRKLYPTSKFNAKRSITKRTNKSHSSSA